MGFNPNSPAIRQGFEKGLMRDTGPAPKPAVDLPTPGELAAAEVTRWCEEAGWEVPVTEHRFHPTRKWRFDMAWPVERLALEFQGGIWGNGYHNRAKGFTKDCEKFSTAAVMGWRLMPVTYAQFKSGQLLGWLEQAFEGV